MASEGRVLPGTGHAPEGVSGCGIIMNLPTSLASPPLAWVNKGQRSDCPHSPVSSCCEPCMPLHFLGLSLPIPSPGGIGQRLAWAPVALILEGLA